MQLLEMMLTEMSWARDLFCHQVLLAASEICSSICKMPLLLTDTMGVVISLSQ
jgi:hypothetical protein